MTLQSQTIHDATRLRTGQGDRQLLFQARNFQLRHTEDDRRIELGYAGSRVLERLLLNPGEVVSRDELLEYGWTDRVVSQGSLNQQIYVLRQILGDEKSRQIIQTLPRRGYRFNPEFIASEASFEPALSGTVSHRPHPRRKLPHWMKLGGLLALTPLLATCATL